ncbi:unnamed protein product [Hermetia illucens]|uniref:Ribonuclease 3 n=1 Tax=Hermetia illucens TaxID=343691 RepID=A0A7R8V091_HERIL|nr:ribonuclease 3 [Hermetia illucens]CAD7089834.1 unnamed protein product [Hermetia illucens]
MNIPPPDFTKPPPDFSKPPPSVRANYRAGNANPPYPLPPPSFHNPSVPVYCPNFPPPVCYNPNIPPPNFAPYGLRSQGPASSRCPPPRTGYSSQTSSGTTSPRSSSSFQSSRFSSHSQDRSRRPTTTSSAHDYGSHEGSSPYSRRASSLGVLESKSSRLSSTRSLSGSTADSQSSRERSEHLSRSSSRRVETERERLLKNWRANFCETSEEIAKKLAEIAGNEEKETWIRSSPAEIYYRRLNEHVVEGSTRLDALCQVFEDQLVARVDRERAKLPPYQPPERKRKVRLCRHECGKCSSSDSSEEEFEPHEDCSLEELSQKMAHPQRLHPDLWHNEPGEINDGPLCRCSIKSRRTGIRHGIYPGEKGFPKCNPNSNNAERLYHYRITISPPTNFLTKTPTIIKHDQHEFIFEGFSLLSHVRIGEFPTCKVIRFNIEYTIHYIEEKMPENFTVKELDLFFKYLFHELLELVDFHLMPAGADPESVCPCYHFLPRFVRDLEDNGKEVLAMSEVLKYLLDSSGPLVDRNTLEHMNDISQNEWQDYVDYIKGMVVTNPAKRPCSVRIDQLDRNVSDLPECVDNEVAGITHPVIVHFGIRPPQLSYAGNREYQKVWREYSKYRHLIANMSKPSYDDKRKLKAKEAKLVEMRTQCRMKRSITVAISSKGFFRTGIMCDIVQHAMLIPVLTTHLRFHHSLGLLEQAIEYNFQNRYLLQLALTHPSYKENFGTNPDHARNSLTNCGIRQPEYGDRKIHYMNRRKRGINTLINIMSRFGKKYETDSNITHNERLEFLGDAVVEFLTSIHLFFMFPELEEGGLATYRAAIVQNQHLAVLASKFQLEQFMLYAHGSDLCNELELRHAMANCFEALMGALLLDGGITVADKVFARALWMTQESLKDVWENYPPHPLQEQEPLGDRKWIESYQMLKDLTKFEDSIGVQFKHIRLLARAFTDRSIGFTHLTLGSNQRLEFLGDTVLQLICSEYLYRHFPEHHEGHLSLLRSSLVNNRTQAMVCDDLGMTQFAVYLNHKADLKTKDRADLLEAFLGALYVDKGLEYCETFCQVCLFPRLQVFIMNQDWNDPKSKLQQCCLTLRTMDGDEPDIPVYKVIECIGPTNIRVFTVAVYFRGKRLATASGPSIQQAEMNAAKYALENSRELFPQLDHQRRVISQSIKQQGKGSNIRSDSPTGSNFRGSIYARDAGDDSHLPKQYRIREDVSSDELSVSSDDYKRDTQKRKKRKHKKKRSRSSSKAKSSVEKRDDDSNSDTQCHPEKDSSKKKDHRTYTSEKSGSYLKVSEAEEVSDVESGEII